MPQPQLSGDAGRSQRASEPVGSLGHDEADAARDSDHQSANHPGEPGTGTDADGSRRFRPGWRRSRRLRGFDPAADVRARRVIAFIEKLRVPNGNGAGRQFKLRPWQRDWIYAIYANGDGNGNRLTRRAILSIARKNGKTALIAALVLVHLVGPEAGFNMEIVSAANDREQAGQVFKYLTQIIALSPRLTSILKIVESKKRVVYHGRRNVYAAVSADARRKHGLNPALVIYDELAQSTNRDLYDSLDTAQGAQAEPLFLTISTQSNDPQHPLSELIDDGLTSEDETIVCHLYEVPDDVKDIFDESCWYDANPALGDFRSLDDMRAFARRAKRLPSLENVFRNLYLNQRVSLLTALFSRSVWMDCAGSGSLLPGEEVVMGLDFAETTDLCALAVFGTKSRHLEVFFWKPEQVLDEHGRRDRRDYLAMYQQGILENCPGKTIAPELVSQKIGEIHAGYKVLGLAYDRWRINRVIKSLDDAGIDCGIEEGAALRLYPWGQGFKDMAPAVDALELAVVEQQLNHSNHPLLNTHMANAIVALDPAGNRKLDKEKSRMRIDGAVAAAMALGLNAALMSDDDEQMNQFFNSLR